MLQSSKLSNRFKKEEKEDIEKEQPKRFVFSKSAVNQENLSVLEQLSEKEEPEAEDTYENFEAELKQALLDKIDSIPVWFEYTSERQKGLIKSFVENKLFSANISIAEQEKETLIDKLFTSIMGFGPLDYLIAQENVDAVFVNGTNSVHIEIGGKILNTEMALNEKQIGFILNNISSMSGIKIDNSKNIWKCKADNLLINVILPPVSLCGINISLRKISTFNINSILEKNMMTVEIFDFLVSMADAGKNIVLSGDINSGKTTLLEALISGALINKRIALVEEFPYISASGNTLMKFVLNCNSSEYTEFWTDLLKIMPEHIAVDLNSPIPEISDVNGNIITLRAASVDAAMSKLISNLVAVEKLPEKYAKTKVLTDYDYIVQINLMKDGTRKVTSIVELTPARTAALSVKVIAKFVDGQYVTEIPQPLTSIRAESLLSESGVMSSRFYPQG